MTDQTPCVVVPVEPTEAMIEAFLHAEGPAGPDRVVSWSVAAAMARGNVFRHLDDIFANAYRSMLAAAPAPSSLAGGEVLVTAIDHLTKRLDKPGAFHMGDEPHLHAILAALPPKEAPAEDDARRKLIQCIEEWDSETEYDADDLASLADGILHEFNGPPVVSRADPVELSSNPCQMEAPAATGAGERGRCDCLGADDLCACQNQPMKDGIMRQQPRSSQVAFTKLESPYPGYINITREGETVTVAIRGDARDGNEGPHVCLTVTREEWLKLHMEAGYRI